MKIKESEEELIQGCLRNSRAHQEALYNKYASKMFAVCMRYANDSMQAEDSLQEGFVRVFTRLNQFKGEGSLEGWIRRVVVNTSLQHIRSQKINPFTSDDIDEVKQVGTDDMVLEKMSANEIFELISKLPKGYRTVFNLYVVEEYSHREIAEELGISEGTSKSQLARARAMLQKWITANEDISTQEYRKTTTRR